MPKREGWEGWDEYAPFYDWENARTLGRRDVPFWQRVVADVRGPVLELGCGTGRIALPLARAGAKLVGIDRSGPMLARADMRHKAARHAPGAAAGCRSFAAISVICRLPTPASGASSPRTGSCSRCCRNAT